MRSAAIREAVGNLRRAAENMHFCPRATVTAAVYDSAGARLGGAVNTRFDGKCDCNTDKTDTKVSAGSSCLAVHAEITLMVEMAAKGLWPKMDTLVMSRAPCRSCLALLLSSPIQTIAVARDWPDRDGTEAMWTKQGRWWRWID